MVAYARIVAGEVAAFPYTFKQFRADHPRTSMPASPSADFLAAWGVVPVTVAPRPDYDPAAQVATRRRPVLVDGAWVVDWDVRDKPQHERAGSERGA